MFNWLFKSQPTLSEELTNFVKQMGQMAKTLDMQSQAFSKLGPSMMSLVSSESPNYQIFFEKIIEIYANLSRYYSRSAKDIERALEDLKDIDQRYIVVKRVESERATVKAAFDIVSENCDNAYKLMNPEKPETVSNYEKAFKIRQEAAQKLFDADNYLLQYNKKFHLFTIRRIKSAWSLYGKALTNLYTLEAGAYSELTTLYKAIRDHYKEPDKILNAMKMNVPPAIFEKIINPQTKTNEETDESNIEQLLENIVIPPIPNYIKNSNDVIMEIPKTSPKEIIQQNLEEIQKEQIALKNVFSDDEDFKSKIPSDNEEMKEKEIEPKQIEEEVVQLSDDEEFSKTVQKKEDNKKDEEERLKKEEEEKERIKKEEEERKQKEAEEEEKRKKLEEEEKLRKEEEERLKKEAEEAELKKQEEERLRKEEEERLKKEEEERLLKEEEEKKKKEAEEAEMKKKEEEERIKQEEEKMKQEEEAKLKKQQEEQSKAAVPKPSPQQPKKQKNKNKKKGRGKKW